MKKIVIGITSPSSIVLLRGQLKYFSDKGYDMYLMCPKNQSVFDFCKNEGCIHVPIKIERDISFFSDIIALLSIYSALKKIKPDIVNLGTPKMGLLGLFASMLLSIPLRIYTCRGFRFEHERGIKRKILMLTEKISAKCSHKIICIAPSVKKLGVDLGLFPENKCVVINKGSSNGISIDEFSIDSVSLLDKDALKKQLKLEDCFVYGFVGRIVDRKGINELYSAFSRLYENNAKYRLLVVGAVEEAQIADKSLIMRLESHPGIVMVGFQKDVSLYMSLMDVFVLPAWWEGFGNVLVQAAAMGIPVISTNSTGCCDAVNDGYNGILVPIKDEESLYQAMSLLSSDGFLANKLGSNGVIWAKNFRQDIIWNGMEQIYCKSI